MFTSQLRYTPSYITVMWCPSYHFRSLPRGMPWIVRCASNWAVASTKAEQLVTTD